MKDSLHILVQKANDGDRKSLEELVVAIQDLVYNLALKMLLYPEDAKDATQEILIKVVTRLSTFKYQSSFQTWVYRVSTNYLINHRGKRSTNFAMSFEDYEYLIDSGHSNKVSYATNAGELALLEEEVKVSCTQGLLLCLPATDRLVYILSEILEFNGNEGAEILEISPESFRKKLSRARKKIRNFLQGKCGLVHSGNPCRCKKKIDFLAANGTIDPKNLRFAQFTQRSMDLIERIGQLEKSVALYRSVPETPAPETILQSLRETLLLE